jgi:hypothetical protein
MRDVPGGTTGFPVRKVRMIGTGKDRQTAEFRQLGGAG